MPIKSLVLVTGASGFLGRRIVRMLVDRGFTVRALVRRASRADSIRLPGVEIFIGDVTVLASLEKAFQGVDFVIHAAADTSGTVEGGRQVTIQGTRNILELCASHDVKKLVYISSCSVYGTADYAPGMVVDETAPLERTPEARGAYSWAKFEAEKIVLEFMAQGKVDAVCLRPGTIYGSGGEVYTPMVGFSIADKIFIVIGDGRFVMPLVYVDNLVQATILALTCAESKGHVYTIVDPQRIDKKYYMDRLIRKLFAGSWCFYFPLRVFSAIVVLQENAFKALKRKPILTSYRLASSQNTVVYDSSKALNHLGWNPGVNFEMAVETMLQESKRNSDEQR